LFLFSFTKISLPVNNTIAKFGCSVVPYWHMLLSRYCGALVPHIYSCGAVFDHENMLLP